MRAGVAITQAEDALERLVESGLRLWTGAELGRLEAALAVVQKKKAEQEGTDG